MGGKLVEFGDAQSAGSVGKCATSPLVRLRRVCESIRDDDGAAIECRGDDARDELGTCCGEQEEFGTCTDDGVGIKEERPYTLAEGCTAGLSDLDDFVVALP